MSRHTLAFVVAFVVLGSATASAEDMSIDAAQAPQIVTGYLHSCGMAAGTLKCWGLNSFGMLGDGTKRNRPKAVAVVGLAGGVTNVSAGASHTCAVSDGRLQCWGDDSFGQLGDNGTYERRRPINVRLRGTVSAVSGGTYFTCAVVNAGVSCWGENGSGQLGDGTIVTRGRPAPVSDLSKVASVASGGEHACALTNTGGVLCWGANDNGQLGDGTRTARHAPVAVQGLQSPIVALTAGDAFTCALTKTGGVKHPLGTAAWHSFGDGDRPEYRSGDLFLGRTPQGHPVGIHDDRHVLITCGTRGGKGVSTVIPNLCLWPGSLVVIDPKGENAMVTARRRANGNPHCEGLGQKVRMLDPFDAVGTKQDSFGDLKVAFNPLDLIDPKGTEGIDTAARIADALISSDSAVDPFWEESARTLIKALILHVASGREFKREERNLATVRRLMMAGDESAHQLLAASGRKKIPSPLALLFAGMKRNRAFSGVVANAGEMFANMDRNAARTLASIIQVACTNTDFLDSPEMQRCLAKSDFRLSELKTDPKGMSLYLSLPQRFMPVHFRWLRMMTTLIITEMERVPHLPKSGHPVMTVLDEFPALRRMRSIENAAAQIAGFGVKMVFVAQTLAQMKDIYKDNWETFVANAGVRLFWNVEDHFTRDYASKLVGECEVVRDTASQSSTNGVTNGTSKSDSTSWSLAGPVAGAPLGNSTTVSRGESSGSNWSSTSGTSEAIHKRLLIAPDEVGRLFGNTERPALLALVSGQQPMALRRVRYFEDRTFVGLFDGHKDHGWPPTLEQSRLAIAQEQRQREEAAEAQRRRLAEEQARLQAKALAEAERQRRIEEARERLRIERDLMWQRQARREAWIRRSIFTVAFLTFGSGATWFGTWMLDRAPCHPSHPRSIVSPKWSGSRRRSRSRARSQGRRSAAESCARPSAGIRPVPSIITPIRRRRAGTGARKAKGSTPLKARSR